MLGLLVIIMISWGILHLIEKRTLGVLGVLPLYQKSLQFSLGFGLMAAIVLCYIGIETYWLDLEWQSNVWQLTDVLAAFWYHLKSALTEDLVFRGAILYVLIKRIGSRRAILCSATVFGVYHWFSYGILQERFILLAYILLITGITGWVWAWSFYKSKSIMIGLGLHVSYNLVMSFFYENQPYGQLLFTQLSQVHLTGWDEFYYSMFRGLFPSVCTLLCLKLIFGSAQFKRFFTSSSCN